MKLKSVKKLRNHIWVTVVIEDFENSREHLWLDLKECQEILKLKAKPLFHIKSIYLSSYFLWLVLSSICD